MVDVFSCRPVLPSSSPPLDPDSGPEGCDLTSGSGGADISRLVKVTGSENMVQADSTPRSGDQVIEHRPARYDRRKPSPPTVSVIVPTYNECENIPVLLERLTDVLADFDYEIVVVDDDSPDGTWRVVEELATTNRRIRVLRRRGRRGLSAAVVEGMVVAQGTVLAVIDADLQHDETVLPQIISAVLDDEVDLCLGSRQAPGGSYGRFGPTRRFISWSGAQLARRLLGITVSDPMSGYFAVSRARFEAVRPTLNPRGFKVMLELLARGPRPRVAEVGYRFRSRTSGQTKLSSTVAKAYVVALLDLSLARPAPALFAAYVAMAITGLSLRLSLLSFVAATGPAALSELVAVEAAILVEFWLHSSYTFSRRRGQDPRPLQALFRFQLISLHAFLALSGLADIVEGRLTSPQSLSQFLAALGLATTGVAATIVVGYMLNTTFTWPDPERHRSAQGRER